MCLPIEYCISGRPASVNGKSKKKQAWKKGVDAATRTALAAKMPHKISAPYDASVMVKVYLFPASKQYTDVDNVLKYTVDGMVPSLLKNDKQVDRVVAQRVIKSRLTSILVSLPHARAIADAIDLQNNGEFGTAIKVEIFNNKEVAW
ncbi:RusA family crossover junction endodeoxyribonuclease [Azohydromonas lata]|uniref:RusA family crossover junction endodeoxyribonuclease n=1 Tax=Azohydromonas lata TaxID=45677 RepID=A0ABU5IG18_9BURK|nr:RusA family crossover junction endodeoxyribonuclease [Azohydromonas lata]MDZ5458014.1 RusA family crossover junction endodeoxyribonuclease [Azohydromonas lata]